MTGNNAEIHISGGKVYKTRMILSGLEEKQQLIGNTFGSLFSNMDSKWLRSYERATLYGETLEIIDYSPEIDTYLKAICFPTFKGHCSCILFDISEIKSVKNSGDGEKALMFTIHPC